MKKIAVIPAHNEEQRVATVVQGALKFADKVIVVDDGSTDKTAQAAKDAGATTLTHLINLGKGATLKTGTIAAIKLGADIIIHLDADGQHDPSEIQSVSTPVIEGSSDISLGVRATPQYKRMPFVLRLGNSFFKRLSNIFFSVRVDDPLSGFRVFRKEAYQHIEWESSGYTVEMEILYRANRNGLKISEVPIKTVYLDRYKGTTVFDGFDILWKMIIWRLS